MDFYAKAEQLNDKDFKQIIRVEKATFDAMIKILDLFENLDKEKEKQ